MPRLIAPGHSLGPPQRWRRTFGTPRSYRAGKCPDSVAIGDLSGDGSPELVTYFSDFSVFRVLTNRGDGTFGTPASYDLRGGEGDNLALGDLNRDRKPDLATTTIAAVSVVMNATGLCGVPAVRKPDACAAERKLRCGHCRMGAVRHVYSTKVKPGRVVSTQPRGSVARCGRSGARSHS